MTTPSLATAMVGLNAGDYQLTEHVGDGQFGVVFRGVHRSTGSVVAIKVLSLLRLGDAQAAAEFQNEGELLKKLQHRSNVINWFETDTANVPITMAGSTVSVPIPYHALAWASGDLDEIVADPTALAAVPWRERLHHWRGAVLGVHQMHLSRVAHRDLKAANCLLMVGAKNSVDVRIADLGRAKDFDTSRTVTREQYLVGRGDPSHAAPEFLRLQGGTGHSDFCHADLYGLGSLLVEVATGQSMTALAIGDWQSAIRSAQTDLQHGVSRDLSTLRPQYVRAANEAARTVPPEIRENLRRLVLQLCDPVPEQRLPMVRGARLPATSGLDWLIRKADGLSRQLKLAEKRSMYGRREKGEGA